MRVAFSDSDGGFTRIALWKLNTLLTGPIGAGFALTSAMRDQRGDYSRYGIAEAVSTLRGCDADFALLPLHNTISGFNQTTLDALGRLDLAVLGEITTKIEHALVAPRMAVLGIGDLDYKASPLKPFSQKDLVRAAIVFGKKLRDLYGHPQSFEQCEAAILNEDLPRKDHHRWQTDPVRMVGQMIECLLSGTEAKEFADALRYMAGASTGAGGGGGSGILPWGSPEGGVGIGDLGLSGGHFCVDVQRPNPFIAALAPKGLYPTWQEKEPGSGIAKPPPFGAIAPHYLSDDMIELLHPVCSKLDEVPNYTRFILVGRSDGANNKAIKDALRASLEPARGLTTKIEGFNVHRKMLVSANAKTQMDWQTALDDTQEELKKFPWVLPSPCFLPPQCIVHCGKAVALMEVVRTEKPEPPKKKNAAPKPVPTSAELEKVLGDHLKHKAHWSDRFSWGVDPPKADGLNFLGVYPSFDEGDANYGKCKKDEVDPWPWWLRLLIGTLVFLTMLAVTAYVLSCLHKHTRWLDNHPQFNSDFPIVKQIAEVLGQYCYSCHCDDTTTTPPPPPKECPPKQECPQPPQVSCPTCPDGREKVCPTDVPGTSLPPCDPACDTDSRCVVYRKPDGSAGTRCLKPCPTAVEPRRKPSNTE